MRGRNFKLSRESCLRKLKFIRAKNNALKERMKKKYGMKRENENNLM